MADLVLRRKLCGKTRIRIRNGLVKSEGLDVTAEFAQRVETFCRASARIAHEIVETVLTRDDDKMRHAARQSYSHDDRVSPVDIRIDQLIRREVFVHVPDAIRREPCRTVPINPAVLGVSAH